MVEKINEGGNKDSTELRRVDLVEAFNKALKEHPLKTMGQYYVSIADLSEEEKARMNKQMEHFLQPSRESGGEPTFLLIFRFEGDKEKLGLAFHRSMTEDDDYIYYINYPKMVIDGEDGWYYLRYDKHERIFEIGAQFYSKSLDEKVIEKIRGELKTIDDLFRMDLETIKVLFGTRRG